MPKTKLFDKSGKGKGVVNLNPAIFAAKINSQLMAQAVRVRRVNASLGTRKTKDRGEVRGGGRKPWRQKGTGRARHGSIRSPIWVGGGHAHALLPTDRRLRLGKKQRRQALFSALSQRLNEGKIFVLDSFGFKEIKTRSLKEVLESLNLSDKTLIVLPGKDEVIERSARNLPGVKTLEARLLNAFDVLRYQAVLMVKESLGVLEGTFLGSSSGPKGQTRFGGSKSTS